MVKLAWIPQTIFNWLFLFGFVPPKFLTINNIITQRGLPHYFVKFKVAGRITSHPPQPENAFRDLALTT
jgi:hypothetical protein